MNIYISKLFLICVLVSVFSSESIASNTNYTIDKHKDVGDIPFQTNTTPAGALSYTVPVECYQNPTGSQPNISLAYSSMSGNGVAGMGWSIGGLSVISRVNSTEYYDGEVRPANLSYSSAFTLDGVRLVRKLNSTDLESESGNIIVKPYKRHFEVFYPNGNKAIYGYKDGANFKLSFPLTWIEDKNGNYIEYMYTESNNVYYIDRINYGATTTNGHYASLRFSYTLRNDVIPYYFDKEEIKQTLLLKDVKTYFEESQLKTYTLIHETGHVNFLTKIGCSSGNKQLNPLVFTYGSDKKDKLEISKRELLDYPATLDTIVALIPVKFSAKEPTNGLVVLPQKSAYYFGNYSSNPLKIPGFSEYLDQDTAFIYKDIMNLKETYFKIGLRNFVFGNRGASVPMDGIFRGLFTMDYRGVGADNILIIGERTRGYDENISTHRFDFYNSSGIKEDSLQISIHENLVRFSKLGSIACSISRTYLTGDFTGEGYEDLLYLTHHRDFNGDKRPSTAVYVDFRQKRALYNQTCFDVDPEDIVVAIDFDGDGRSEIFHMNEQGISVYKFDVNFGFKKIAGYEHPISMLPSANNRAKKMSHTFLFGDINGDGKTDIIQSAMNAELYDFESEDNWTYYFSNGKDGFIRTDYSDTPSSYPEKLIPFYPDNKYILQDVDGDGLPDLVVLDQQGTVSVHKNIKGRFRKEPEVAPEKIDKSSKLVISRVRETNKRYPIMGIKGGNLSLIRSSVNQQENRLMSSSISSYGVETKHSYATLTDNEVCTVGDKDTISFPYNYLVEDIYVVKDLETIYNDISISSTSYNYTNPIVHRQGLGFRGFEQVSVTDNLRDKTTRQTFNPQMFGVLTGVQTPTMSVKSEYDTLFEDNKRVQVLLKKEVRSDILNTTATTSAFEYDAYGNMTKQSVYYGDSIKTLTSRTLDNIDTPNKYLLGLIKEEKQTDTRNGSFSSSKRNIEYNSLYLPESKKNYYNDNLVSEEKYKYDAANNLEQVQVKTYATQNWLTTSYKYDDLGRVIKETDPLGLFTEYFYEGKNLLQSVRNHKGHEAKYAYDAWGRNISISYPDGTVESSSLAWTDSPTGAVIVSTTTATGQPDTQTYIDVLGRTIRTGQKRFDGVYLYTDNVYDNLGRILKSSLPFRGTNPTHWNTYEYDSYDRIKVLSYASGKKDTYSYGKLQTRSDIDGVASIKTYDVSGQVISIEDATGTITYNFRADGQPSSIVAPGDIETSFEYDIYGRQTKIIDPSAGTKIFEFDTAGNINKETDARGKATKMTYDVYNRLIGKEVVGELTTTYSFNTDGLSTGESSSNGTSTVYLYDNLFKLKTEKNTTIDGKWLQKTYTYAEGNLSSTIYTTQSEEIATENYIYTNGHNTELKLHDGTSIWKLTGENNMGMPSSSTTGILSRTYSYDNFGLPTSRIIKNGTTVIQDFSYKFDSQTGNLTWRKDNTRGLQENFTYDKINRLTGFGNKKMSYDVKGNIIYFPNVGQFKYNSPKPYALTAIVSCEQGDLDGLENYRRNQTVAYTNIMRPLFISENNRITTFSYNGNGDRVKMLTQRGDTTELERYYIGGEYEIDKTVAGTEERLYLGGDAYSAAAVYVKQGTGAWQVQYIGRDYLGSITHVMDATGIVKQELSYNPWGRLRNPITQALYDIDNRLKLVLGDRGYTGHEHLTSYGLINMNARLYDPVVGRFLSPDPYVQAPDFSQNFNRYSYALNNPLRYTDPNGEFVWIPFVAAALIGGGLNWWAHGANFDMAGLKYFGIGMGVGIAGYVTGGAAFTALAGAGAAIGTGGALIGVGAGAIGFFGASTVSMLGNNVLMGDPMPTPGEMATGLGISMATGGIMNGTMAAVNGNNFWTGAPRAFGRSAFAFNNTPRVLAPGKIEPLGIQLANVQQPGANLPQSLRNSNLSNAELVQIAGEEATMNIPGADRFIGSIRHRYAQNLINEYQGAYGNRGLNTNQYFRNDVTGAKGYLDILDTRNKVIYDYKWGYPNKSLDWFHNSSQMMKYQNQYQDHSIVIIRF